MKAFRTIIGLFLILVIIGGTGFLVWNLIGTQGNMLGMNMGGDQNKTAPHGQSTPGNQTSPNTQTPPHSQPDQNKQDNNTAAMPGMQNKTNILNTMALKNKDRLTQVMSSINEAVNQITMDPYSRITLPGKGMAQPIPGQQGNTTVNIYPNGSTVNAPPQGTVPPAAAPTVPNAPNANVVYNQSKLEQLHNGIFKMSQGLMLLNELNDELSQQTTLQLADNYDNYVTMYNSLQQNKTKLNRSLSMINEASFLININPYASGTGYEYDPSQMDQLHRGIYKLAQGMLSGMRLSEDFTRQMTEVSTQANNAPAHGVNTAPGFSIGSIDVRLILYIIIIVFIIAFILALLGAIRSAFRPAR